MSIDTAVAQVSPGSSQTPVTQVLVRVGLWTDVMCCSCCFFLFGEGSRNIQQLR